jgi:hypothetical protein
MGKLPYNNYKESGEEWAAARGYLARTPETSRDIEEQNQKYIDAKNNRDVRDERLAETFNIVNRMSNQIYYCYNCYYVLNRKSEVRIGDNFCGYCGNKMVWPSKL